MTMMILLPVDGSAMSDRAAQHVVRLRREGLSLDVVLLNVQAELSKRGSRGPSRGEATYYQKEGEAASQSAATILAQGGVLFRRFVRVGPVAETIMELANEESCDMIVMGTRGLGAVPGMKIGSIALKVVQSGEIPVTLVG